MDEPEVVLGSGSDGEDDGPYRRRSLWLFRLVALGLALTLLAYFAVRPAPQEGGIERLPKFELELLGDEGGTLGSDDLAGAPVILNFWASWCIPCREEMPMFQEVFERYEGRGIQFVGVDVRDSPDKAQAFIDKLGITYPIVVDPDLTLLEEITDFDGLPLTFFVRADGTFLEVEGVGATQIGAVSEEQLIEAIDLLLETGTA
ncbi:MAG: TlpA family protein disulfide reductase [Actinobacteria bacterium]|nr:TlpA family protein disulfide reductase [Actinomycetota bacterium]